MPFSITVSSQEGYQPGELQILHWDHHIYLLEYQDENHWTAIEDTERIYELLKERIEQFQEKHPYYNLNLTVNFARLYSSINEVLIREMELLEQLDKRSRGSWTLSPAFETLPSTEESSGEEIILRDFREIYFRSGQQELVLDLEEEILPDEDTGITETQEENPDPDAIQAEEPEEGI